MRRVLLIMMLYLCCYGACLSAGEVSELEAPRKAQQFMQGRTFGQKNLRRAALSAIANGAFYVFNADGGNGFVIVSADDRTEEILGYADEGSWDMDHFPANAQAWLEDYARQIRSLRGQSMRTDYGVNSSSGVNSQDDLIQYFGYSKSATSITHAHFTTEEWEGMIYNEVSHKRPVLYSGRRLQGQPTGKGVYIVNGRKVVVR